MFTDNKYYKDNRWNHFIMWIHRRILYLASLVLKLMQTISCDGCIHYDDYGCGLIFLNQGCNRETLEEKS
jgi:hypothetical protein